MVTFDPAKLDALLQCVRDGVFSVVTPEQFARMSTAERDKTMIQQGERIRELIMPDGDRHAE